LYIGVKKGFFRLNKNIFLDWAKNFREQSILFAQILGFMEYTLVYSCVCMLQIELRF
jgi:hypothetical protein